MQLEQPRASAGHFHGVAAGGCGRRKSSQLEALVARKAIEHPAHGSFEPASAKVSLLLLMLSSCLRVIIKATHTEGRERIKKSFQACWVGVILMRNAVLFFFLKS